MERIDVAIIGAGPAGLAVALELKRRGVEAMVIDRQRGPIDKACGEGLMPAGLSALERLGVRRFLTDDDAWPFESISYWQEDGRAAVGKLPAPGGLGVRRLALARAFRTAAEAERVTVREGCAVRSLRREAGRVVLETDSGLISSAFVIGADGLHSPTRKWAGLEGAPTAARRRFGLRQHLRMTPWSHSVEIFFAPGIEAYVTGAGKERVGIAFLWSEGLLDVEKVSFPALLERFPRLAEKVRGAPSDSTPRGAGPLLQAVTRRVAPNIALVGDAAGYVDAITGEGLSLAFEGASALAECFPNALRSPEDVLRLAAYERHAERAFAKYARLASTLVWVAQRPSLRRRVIGLLGSAPPIFDAVLRGLAAPTNG